MALAVISPVAARNRAQAGVGCQGGFAPPCPAALPLTACPGCAFSPASDGGISSRAAPFSKIGKGRGKKVDPLHYVPTKYFLSPAQCSQFLRLAEIAGCPPPAEIEALLLKQGGVYRSPDPFNVTVCGHRQRSGQLRRSETASDCQLTLFPLC